MTSIGAIGGTTQNPAYWVWIVISRRRGSPASPLILVGSLADRITMGWLADRRPKKHVMVLVYAIVALSIPPLATSSTPAMLRLCAFVFGIGLAATTCSSR
jgi:MFS family permease